MSIEVNGHTIEPTTRRGYEHSIHIFECQNEGCYLRSKGEFNSRDRIKELAEEFQCPSGTASCLVCSKDLRPSKDICKGCNLDLDVGEIIYKRE